MFIISMILELYKLKDNSNSNSSLSLNLNLNLKILLFFTINYINYIMAYLIDSLALFSISLMSYLFPCLQSNQISVKLATSYIASTIHAIMVSLMSALVTLGENMPLSLYYYSIGYYVSDIWFLLYINVIQSKSIFTETPLIIHHLVMLLYEGYSIIYDTSDTLAFYFMNRVLLAEIAVIPLNALWYFRTYNSNNKRGITISGISLAITYFFSRVVNLSILFVEVFYSPIRYVGLCGFPVLVFNYMWFYKIMKGCFKQLKK